MGHIMNAVGECILGVKELLKRRTNDLYQPDPQCHKDTNAGIIECVGIGAENGKRAFYAELEHFTSHHHGALSALDDLQSRKNPPQSPPSNSMVVATPPLVGGA